MCDRWGPVLVGSVDPEWSNPFSPQAALIGPNSEGVAEEGAEEKEDGNDSEGSSSTLTGEGGTHLHHPAGNVPYLPQPLALLPEINDDTALPTLGKS